MLETIAKLIIAKRQKRKIARNRELSESETEQINNVSRLATLPVPHPATAPPPVVIPDSTAGDGSPAGDGSAPPLPAVHTTARVESSASPAPDGSTVDHTTPGAPPSVVEPVHTPPGGTAIRTPPRHVYPPAYIPDAFADDTTPDHAPPPPPAAHIPGSAPVPAPSPAPSPPAAPTSLLKTPSIVNIIQDDSGSVKVVVFLDNSNIKRVNLKIKNGNVTTPLSLDVNDSRPLTFYFPIRGLENNAIYKITAKVINDLGQESNFSLEKIFKYDTSIRKGSSYVDLTGGSLNTDPYYQKYLKYKTKYLNLKTEQ
jgi:hypothetical protein